MGEASIGEGAIPEVNIEELFTAQGADYSKRAPREDMVALNLKILEEAKTLIKPRAVWQELKVLGLREQELKLEGGLTLRGGILPAVLGKAASVLLFAMTIGGEIDRRVKEYSEEGDTLAGFILDSAGSAIMVKAANIMLSEVEAGYKAKELGLTFPMGPGHSYWKGLDDVRTMIDFLQAERIGIQLTNSNLMLPKKSICMLVGIGKDLPDFKGKSHCDFCHLQATCNMRHLGLNDC